MKESMKTLGLVRIVDELGRICIPSDFRSYWNLSKDSPVRIIAYKDYVMIEPAEPTCIFCKSSCNLLNYRGKAVCISCAKDVNVILNQPL